MGRKCHRRWHWAKSWVMDSINIERRQQALSLRAWQDGGARYTVLENENHHQGWAWTIKKCSSLFAEYSEFSKERFLHSQLQGSQSSKKYPYTGRNPLCDSNKFGKERTEAKLGTLIPATGTSTMAVTTIYASCLICSVWCTYSSHQFKEPRTSISPFGRCHKGGLVRLTACGHVHSKQQSPC